MSIAITPPQHCALLTEEKASSCQIRILMPAADPLCIRTDNFSHRGGRSAVILVPKCQVLGDLKYGIRLKK